MRCRSKHPYLGLKPARFSTTVAVGSVLMTDTDGHVTRIDPGGVVYKTAHQWRLANRGQWGVAPPGAPAFEPQK